MPVGDDVALGIHDHTRTQRTLAHGASTGAALAALPALAPLTSEEAVKEVIEGAGIVVPVRYPAPPLGSLDGGFSVDIDHAGLKLLGNLRELVRELLRRRHSQLGYFGGG